MVDLVSDFFHHPVSPTPLVWRQLSAGTQDSYAFIQRLKIVFVGQEVRLSEQAQLLYNIRF